MTVTDRRDRGSWRPGGGAPRALGPPRAFALAALVCAPAIAGLALAIDAPMGTLPIALAAFLGGCAVALRGLAASYPHRALGACNAVTLARMALAATLLAAALAPEVMAQHRLAVVALACSALALDGVDGWLARRAGLASAFGARFDMEVDAALATVLALIALRAGPAEGALAVASLLVLGGTRYAFVAAARLLPWLAAPLPERRSRKVVCVVQIAALIALLLPALGAAAATAIAATAAGLLLWSFGRDVRWLGRRAG